MTQAIPRHHSRDYVLPGLLIAALLALAVYGFGLNPGGHDISYHLFRITDVANLLSQGVWAAELSPAAANGKGLPVYVFYSQWVYWLPAALVLLGVPVFLSLKFAYVCFAVVALSGCYRLARLHVPLNNAVMATALFASSVYFIGLVFTRGAYAEFAAYAWLPWVLLAMHRSLHRQAGAIPLALALSLVILCHLVSFLNILPAMLAYALYLQGDVRRVVRAVFPGLVLSLLVTMFFWLPAIMETPYVRGISVFPETYAETLVPLLHQLGSFELPLNAGPLLAWIFIWLMLRTLWRYVRGGDVPARSAWLLAGVLAYVLLMSTGSAWLWERFPLLQSNAFAWRLMMPLVMLASLYAAIAVHGLVLQRRQTAWVAVVLVLAITQVVLYLWVRGDRPVWRTVPIELVEQRIQGHAAQNWGWGVYEYLPMPGAAPQPPAGHCVLDVPMTAVQRQQQDWQIQPVSNEAGCLLRLPLYWHVRYEAWHGDQQLALYASAEGDAVVMSGKGNEAIRLRWTRPLYILVSDAVSIIAVLLVLAVMFRRRIAA